MSARRPAAVALATWLLATVAGGARGEDEPAVLIRRSTLVTPPSMAGASVVPEVSARLAVDARGRVTGVEVLAIEPASELDALLRREVDAQLRDWRFAPAASDGIAIASTVDLRIQFRAFPESGAEVTADLARSFYFGDPERRAAELLRLPFEQRKEVVDRFARVAERHLDRDARRRAETPRFVAITDATDEKVAATLAANLEATWNQFLAVFAAHLEPQPERYKMAAYLFRERAGFQSTQLELRDGTLGEGFYAAPGFLAFHQEVLDPGDLLATMIHEAFHAFSDRLLRRPGRPGERWLEEGLAEYFGSSEIKRGELVPGRTLHRKFLMHYGQVFKLRTSAGITVAELKRAVRRGEAPTVRELFEATRQDFYGERLQHYYGTAWMLVHFLRHGEPEWREGAFPAFLLYVYEGYPAEAALGAAYGLAVTDVERRFVEYVRGF
ncbi:MAG TPA: hypothetical protein VMV46_22300 [Thermoanaerobaculia bacterium]|nr:hypothetical protein [Thermoanaerobaculia bacterium]